MFDQQAYILVSYGGYKGATNKEDDTRCAMQARLYTCSNRCSPLSSARDRLQRQIHCM